MAYKGFTEAQAKAHKRYIENRATIQIVTTAENRETIKAHANKQGESVNTFVLRAVNETIEREASKDDNI